MKRGQTDYSFIVAINKPTGCSSHSALNILKRTLGEARIGHCGTLDPFAKGVLIALVGPAARLNKYITCDNKSYIAKITFGKTTTTDDIDGQVIEASDIPLIVKDSEYANSILHDFTGNLLQIPPVYSAIKQDGRKACDEARRGNVIDLKPREVTVLASQLLKIEYPSWDVSFNVSKGTFIRAIARDIGKVVGCGAFLSSLERTKSGKVSLDLCVDNSADKSMLLKNRLDPAWILGFPVFFVNKYIEKEVMNGNAIKMEYVEVLNYIGGEMSNEDCCTSKWRPCDKPLIDNQYVCALTSTGLKSIYKYKENSKSLIADCVFSKEVSRGAL